MTHIELLKKIWEHQQEDIDACLLLEDDCFEEKGITYSARRVALHAHDPMVAEHVLSVCDDRCTNPKHLVFSEKPAMLREPLMPQNKKDELWGRQAAYNKANEVDPPWVRVARHHDRLQWQNDMRKEWYGTS